MDLEAKVKELKAGLAGLSKQYKEEHQDDAFYKFVSNSVEAVGRILSAANAVLKKRGFDIEGGYESLKTKSRFGLDTLKELGKEAKNAYGQTKLAKQINEIKTKIHDKFAPSEEARTGPPDDDKPVTKKDLKTLEERATAKEKGLLSTFKEGFKNSYEKHKSQPTTDERISDDIERTNKAFANVKNLWNRKKEGVVEKVKEKAGGGLIGNLLKGLMSVGGFIVEKLGGSISLLGGFLAKNFAGIIGSLGGNLIKFLPSAIGGVFTKLIPGMVEVIGGLTKGGLKGAVGGLAKMGWNAAKGLGRMAFSRAGLMAAGRIAGTVASVGIRFLGPIGLAATAIWGGYKLYKYLRRDHVSSDIFGFMTLHRLKLYGLDESMERHYHTIFDLEMKLKDYIIFQDNQVYLKKLDDDIKSGIRDIFGITDENKATMVPVFDTWFRKRFVPVFMNEVRGLKMINSEYYLDTLDNMKTEEVVTFLNTLKIPGDIFYIHQIPFDNYQITITQDAINKYFESIQQMAIKANGSKKSEVESRFSRNRAAAVAKQSQSTQRATTPATPVNTKPTTPAPVPVRTQAPTGNVDDKEAPPKTTGMAAQTAAKATDKLNQASGQLESGDPSLSGINLVNVDKENIYSLDPNVFELFTGMAKEYSTLTGKQIPVTQAFRSYDEQMKLYNADPTKAAKPGNSTHEYGLAIDIDSKTADDLDNLGLLRKYGFTRPIGKETWHLEPIGVSIDPLRAKNDTKFRTSAVLASVEAGGGGYGTLADSLKKHRDIPYQLQIYNSNAANKVDTSKVINKTIENTFGGENKNMKTFSVDSKPTSEVASTVKSYLPSYGKPNDQATTKLSPSLNPTQATYQAPTNNLNMNYGDMTKPLVTSSTQSNTDLSKYSNLSPADAVKVAARLTGVDQNTLLTFAQLESSLNPNASAGTSSAQGLFQFTKGTWNDVIKKYGAKYNIPENASKDNPLYNALMAGEFLKENLGQIGDSYKQAGLSDASAAYMAHFLGAAGAKRLINAYIQSPNAPVQSAISSDAYHSNLATFKDKTVGESVGFIANKINKASSYVEAKYESNQPPSVMNASYTVPTQPPQPKPVSNISNQAVPQPRVAAMPTIDFRRSTVAPKPTNRISTDVSTEKMETLMHEQLGVLSNMLEVMTSINNKMDFNKLREAMMTPPSDAAVKNVPKIESIPKGSVSVRRENNMHRV